jgi:hypothetical protein
VELDRPTIDRVLRRASELEAPAPGEPVPSHAISEESLLAAAAEVGLDPSLVRVSLAIERLGPVTTRAHGDGLLGAGEVVVERVIALDAAAAMDRLDALMVREHQLRTRRSRPNSREWHKRAGAVGAVQRAAKTAAGDAGLCKLERVQATASEVDDHRSVLRVVADRRSQRSGAAAAGAMAGGLGLVTATVAGTLFSPLLLLGAAPLAFGAATTVAKRGRRQQAELTIEIDAVLDAVEHDVPPRSITQSLRLAVNSPRAR